MGGSLDGMLTYQTQKLVSIKSKKLGALHYAIQFIILVYVALFVIAYEKGYQRFDDAIGNVAVKVKGNTYETGPNGEIIIWDAQDVVQPALERDAVFITTNFIATPGQTRGVCPGSDVDEECSAFKNNKCPKMESLVNGISTGVCVNDTFCQLHAWCPVEVDVTTKTNILDTVKDFTVFARNDVKFPFFEVTKNNVAGKTPTKWMNLWTVEQIVSQTTKTKEQVQKYGKGNWTYNDVKELGALIAVIINWDCNLDRPNKPCLPTFEYLRLDDPQSFSKGFNYRYANYYVKDGTNTRDLYKVYGIRIVYLVAGEAGKFNVVPLFVNIGSGIALLAVATVVADFCALYLLPNRKFYHAAKYLSVSDSDDDFTNILGANKQEKEQVRRATLESEQREDTSLLQSAAPVNNAGTFA